MKIMFLTLLLALSAIPGYTQVAGVKDIIRDPAISLRCKALIKDRNGKIRIKQKLNALLQRNKKLSKQVPGNKKTLKMKLDITKTELSNYLRLTKLRIRAMEENIVRKGCPGISL
jgi:hypothetical protein